MSKFWKIVSTLAALACASFVPGAAMAVPASALPDFTSLVKSAGPAVVNVTVVGKTIAPTAAPRVPQSDDPFSEFFRRFAPDQQPRAMHGLGSGFIISADGYVLTNAHVVANASDVTVRLAQDKREYKAKVIGSDKRTDVALLKIDAKGLPTVKLGNSSKLQPGEWVAAIGSPFGFDNTITAGIVSATQRTLPDESFVPFIQTDVAVNPGNSGGPLLNTQGEVVGINSLILSGTGGYMGLSFAIPIEVALDVTQQLRTTGKVTRGRLGVGIQTMTRELAQSFGLDRPRGALVTQVEPNTPAAKAGLQTGDVITKFNGEDVEDATQLTRRVASTKPGSAATISVWRKGATRDLHATIGEFPSEAVVAAAEPAGPTTRSGRLGVGVSELTPEQRKALNVKYGLVVESVDSSTKAPLERGDVIVAINGQPFGSMEEFKRLIAQHKAGDHIAVLVRRGDASVFVPLEVKPA